MSVLQGKHILLGVTGGIAAYKAAFLVRLFIKSGAKVKVIMTPYAEEFVTPLTLSTLSKNPVHSTFSDKEKNWNNHVELGEWADVMLIAPATANTLSKMVTGKSDNLLLTTYLSARCPVFIAPAMDLDMFKHVSSQENLKKLLINGHFIIEPASGELASGLEGKGRMEDPENIVSVIEDYFIKKLPLRDKTILITAGPTYESIDPVRFIGNHSSGKMGFELARRAAQLGAEVTLIAGPTHLDIKDTRVELHRVQSAEEMYNKATECFGNVDIAIASAAVSDYRPKKVSDQKIKKKDNTITIDLIKTKDILAELGKLKKHQILVGFALETNNEEANARDKLERKNLDLVVLNSLNDIGAGFKGDTNKVSLITKNEIHRYDLKQKYEVAEDIFQFLIEKYYS